MSRVHATTILGGIAVSLAVAVGSPESRAAQSPHLFVDASAASDGTGTRQAPFRLLATAVAEGRRLAAIHPMIVISVAAGDYGVASTIVLDYPVMLRGSTSVDFDGDGRPTGTARPGSEANLVADDSLGNSPIVLVRPPAGAPTLSNVVVSNFILVGAPASTTSGLVTLQKAQNFTVSDLIVRARGASAGVDVAASSGQVKKSHVSGAAACGICISAGTAASPATVQVIRNRSIANGAGGLLLSGTTFPLVEVGDLLNAQVNDNDLSQNFTGNLGFGVRVLAFGSVVPQTQTTARVEARINGNRIADNRFALIVDAGFPRRNSLSSARCADSRTFAGHLTVQFNDNLVGPSMVSPALVTFTRAQVFLAPGANPVAGWQYLHGSAISILDPALSLGGVTGPGAFRIDHPTVDPFDNPTGGGYCAEDATREPLGNRLRFNGDLVPDPHHNF